MQEDNIYTVPAQSLHDLSNARIIDLREDPRQSNSNAAIVCEAKSETGSTFFKEL